MFWNVLFCWYCLILSRYILNHPSFASGSRFIRRFVSFVQVEFLSSFCPDVSWRFSSVLVYLLVLKAFLFLFPVWVFIKVLNICKSSLEKKNHILISHLQRLVRLILWYCSLRYVSIISLFFHLYLECFPVFVPAYVNIIYFSDIIFFIVPWFIFFFLRLCSVFGYTEFRMLLLSGSVLLLFLLL